jgi:hypothetical protein
MDDLDSFAAQLQLGSLQLMRVHRLYCDLRISVELDGDLLSFFGCSDFCI